ncbi:RES family NAD+ phosphorylase [Candidatus Poriferisodalis sp.]|uniref:RES family NAD+ phosphorylase n=1 Tax=Candidatus Poriferisodalis sp. TaxID=3101277 RepID=UPI003B016F1C
MNLVTAQIGGEHFRIADPDWADPLDTSYGAHDGQRWNPAGLECLYLNSNLATARANVARRFDRLPYGPEDLDPATAPLLVTVDVPAGLAADAYTDEGLSAAGLPMSYPLDSDGQLIAHTDCQPIGQAASDEGLDGIDRRSAAPGGTRELAWFPRDVKLQPRSRQPFEQWW